jgi:hypothetical protein
VTIMNELWDTGRSDFNRLRKYTRNSRISGVCWHSADVWRADLWIFAVLPGENHATGHTSGMTTLRQSAA